MSAPAPEPGSLRERVALQRRETTPEPEGGHAAVYVPLATVWARVRGLSARLLASADGRASAISHTVVIRFRTDLRPGDRIVWRGRVFEIVSAGDLNGRRAYLSCACTEIAFTG